MSRRQPAGLEVSTFPFLSILFAVIGVLTLFLAGIVITRAIPGDEPPPPRPSVVPGGGGGEVHEPCLPKDECVACKAQVDALAKQLLQHTAEYNRLAKLKTEVEAYIQAKEDEVAGIVGGDRVVQGEPLTYIHGVHMIPDQGGDSTFRKKAVLVEVKAEGFVVHPEKRLYAVADLDRTGSPMATFLAQIDRKRASQYLLLLVHPNGVATYEKLRKYLLKNFNETIREDIIPGRSWLEITKSRIDLGVEPFSDDWLLIGSEE